MSKKKHKGSIISDVLNGAGDPDLLQLLPRGSFDEEYAKLRAAPRNLAERFMIWRVIEAMTHNSIKELVFWSLVFARYYGFEGDAEIASEMTKMLANRRGLN